MPVVLGLVVAALTFGLIFWARAAAERVNAKTDAAWAEAARLLGGRFTRAGGSWYSPTPRRLEAEYEGVAVLVDHYEVSSGENSTTTYTRAISGARAPH